jgi:hypothetical protein
MDSQLKRRNVPQAESSDAPPPDDGASTTGVKSTSETAPADASSSQVRGPPKHGLPMQLARGVLLGVYFFVSSIA